MDKAVHENVSTPKNTLTQKPPTVCRQVGSQLLWVPDADDVLDCISSVRPVGRKHRTKANRNRLGKPGCVPQAPDRPLRPRGLSTGCSVGVLAELRHIPRIMIMYREKRSKLRSTWIFGRSAKRMGTCQPFSPVVVHPMRSTSFNTRRFLCRESQRVAVENGRDPYFVDDSIVSFARFLVPLS